MRRSKADETVNEGGYSGRREVYGYVHKGRKHPLHKPQRKANGSHETTPCCLSSGTMHVHKDGERWRERRRRREREGKCTERERNSEEGGNHGSEDRTESRKVGETVLNHFTLYLSKFCFCTTIILHNDILNRFGDKPVW